MAQDKKSILVYADWMSIFEGLEDDEAGRLIKHFFRYVNDLNPEAPDRITKLVFEPIKQTLKRDLKKYEDKKEKNRQNALIRWDKNDATACDGIKNDANDADNDNDSVSDNDSDIINIPPIVKKTKKEKNIIFYEAEVIKTENKSYHDFVKWLLGENEISKPYSFVLSMDDPVSEKRFKELLIIASENGTKIMDKIRALENIRSNKYKSFNLTLTNWLKKK